MRLLDKSYAPAGITIPRGVEIQEDWGQPWPIAMAITGTLHSGALFTATNGIATGFPYSSATNWTTGTHSYQVILHCTNLPNLSYNL